MAIEETQAPMGVYSGLEIGEHNHLKDLKFENFRRVNLILGPPGVGKTTVLQMLSGNELSLHDVPDGTEYRSFAIRRAQSGARIPYSRCFVPSLLSERIDDEYYAMRFWEDAQRCGSIEALLSFIQRLFPQVTRLEAHYSPFCVYAHSAEKILELDMYGASAQALLRLALVLPQVQKGVLCIDTPESGLSFKAYSVLAHMLLALSEQLNVQVFLSTNSQDFLDVLSEQGHDVARYYLRQNAATNAVYVQRVSAKSISVYRLLLKVTV